MSGHASEINYTDQYHGTLYNKSNPAHHIQFTVNKMHTSVTFTGLGNMPYRRLAMYLGAARRILGSTEGYTVNTIKDSVGQNMYEITVRRGQK